MIPRRNHTCQHIHTDYYWRTNGTPKPGLSRWPGYKYYLLIPARTMAGLKTISEIISSTRSVPRLSIAHLEDLPLQWILTSTQKTFILDTDNMEQPRSPETTQRRNRRHGVTPLKPDRWKKSLLHTQHFFTFNFKNKLSILWWMSRVETEDIQSVC